MKKISLLIALLLCTALTYAQVPQAMNFQAVMRDATGNVLADQVVAVKLSLLQGSINGTIVYEETHSPTTTQNGVVNLQIGNGVPTTGDFTSIDWSQSPYFIRLSINTEGTGTYKEVATSQLLSVPYALYAAKAGAVEKAEETPDFFVSPNNGPSSKFLTGKGEVRNSEQCYLFISYLDQKDQEVTCEIEGLPENTLTKEVTSGPLGQYIKLEFHHTGTGQQYACTCVFKNKYGVTKSYLFTYIEGVQSSIDVITPSTPSDEDILSTLSSIIENYQAYKTFNQAIDNAFMGKSEDSQYIQFKEKSYSPDSEKVYQLWADGYKIIAQCNTLIDGLAESTIETRTTTLKENAIKQAKAIRAYTYLMLTLWFDKVPLVMTSNNESPLYPAQSTRNEVLDAVITDFTEATDVEALLTEAGELSTQEIQLLYLESLLLKKEWVTLSKTEYTEGLPAFAKKIATWKINNTEGVTESSLIEEYLNTYYTISNRGNLYLNTLDYSATYLEIEEYKTILPIPTRELQVNPNIGQNSGY